MLPEQWKKIQDICDKLSKVTYENLTKIIRLESTGSSTAAQKLDDSFQNDVDAWMGGGTCFSMTWHLYQVFKDMGLNPRLVMGHKRKERNIHCALILPDDDPSTSAFHAFAQDDTHTSLRAEGATIHKAEYLFDPGYLIFDPLPIPLPTPFGTGSAFFPLVPNCVRLDRPTMDSMALWTGGAGAPMKLRFEYPVEGVSVEEFKQHWNESFYREMMTYPVLNRLDRERGVQYYFQKGNLVTRDANGSRIEKIEESSRVETLSRIFDLKPELIERALDILKYS
ncbi:MAG: hypothetical protein IK114_01865 [Fibrobacter sp.]|nr:hypothetical protein [Fibrobacter sp.]